MEKIIAWLELHNGLSGWAQFIGAMVALIVTYLTAFMPIWHRKRQLKKAGGRLLMNGYEILESYHRTTPNFLPVSLTLRGGALAIGAVIDEIARFPIYELDDQGSRSLARNLIALNATLIGTKLVFDDASERIVDREATEEERDLIVEFLAARLDLVRKILNGENLERPIWSDAMSAGS
ncbi:hypothetical protein ACFSC3_02960 [Sphingomonas floccifaciens]|uniref:Uncharacterized protein n=1 Tax=Sphingomonas floccifaciens TaxID=1844115 RepID=A0ABW4N8U0_9SPHN